ncbi:transmembrane protein, putative [Medicago truncatula]|uniref:Transmembrane protein, putative n=1 Tax=Medicago truncatula TaxID=3880 RepID=A0A072THD9_MEDTR|nr:transmembrane protein, putative [Medicago truncatula]
MNPKEKTQKEAFDPSNVFVVVVDPIDHSSTGSLWSFARQEKFMILSVNFIVLGTPFFKPYIYIVLKFISSVKQAAQLVTLKFWKN